MLVAGEDFIWEPYGEYLDSRVARFMAKHGIKTWQELIRRSIQDIDWFWPAELEDLGVEWFKCYQKLYDDSKGLPWTKWFLGGMINIVHNCLDRHIRDGRGNKTVFFWEDECGNSRSMTYGELYDIVNDIASAMRAHGIKTGDVVGMCMTVSPEAIAVMFAAMKIGAVPMQPAAAISCEKMTENLKICHSKILFVNDGYSYGGKTFSLYGTINNAVENVASLKKIVVVNRANKAIPSSRKCITFDNFVKVRKLKQPSARTTIRTTMLSAEDPALILFSSGTTGKPKIILHTHGGIMANVPKEIGYAFDYREGDIFFWATNLGWMMAPWEIIGVQFFGGTYVLYDGSPLYPDSHRMFEIIERYGVTTFGFTPSGIDSLPYSEDYSIHDLSSLRILGSTGKPLKEKSYRRFFRLFGKERCPIMNISGGTELIGCLVSPLPIMPLKVSTVGAQGLGMDVAVVEENGKQSASGAEGLLVCRKPFPSMTRGFLGDPELYIKTYFRKGSDVWYHGDRAMVDEDGFFYMLGRDDDLIVKGGIKIDPVEVDDALTSFYGYPRVRDSVTTGADDEKYGDRIISFIIIETKKGRGFSQDKFIRALRTHVKKKYQPVARPDEIYIVDVLPKTLSAKVPRKLYRKAYQGEDLGDLSSIDNPKAFEEIRKLMRSSPGPF